jgi:hypothetical protein
LPFQFSPALLLAYLCNCVTCKNICDEKVSDMIRKNVD